MCITVKKKGFVPHSVTDATYPAKKCKLSAQMSACSSHLDVCCFSVSVILSPRDKDQQTCWSSTHSVIPVTSPVVS